MQYHHVYISHENNLITSEMGWANLLHASLLWLSEISENCSLKLPTYIVDTDYTDSNNNRICLDWRPSKREISTHYCSQTSVNKVQLQQSWINLVRPLFTVENTRYVHVFHSRQWSNYNVASAENNSLCRVFSRVHISVQFIWDQMR